MQRRASAVWQGGIKDGRGTVSTESTVLSATPYSFSVRFEGGFTVTKVHLDVTVAAPGAERAKFEAAAVKAKVNCPISKVLRAEISMDARLAA